MKNIILTADQQHALDTIMAAAAPGRFHILTGFAGSGKTTLMQEFARRVGARGTSIVLTAPTHKAVAVLAAKIGQAGLSDIACRTIHALLSLKPKPHGDRLKFERDRRASPVSEDVVVIDECSMIGAELMAHIKRHLSNCFVLFVGDPAQLPPVGEKASPTFDTVKRNHLDTIIRQEAGNPILDAAHIIRASQGGPMDWSWCKAARAAPLGVFMPRQADVWMEKAFTSPEFEKDPDTFRYLCWTNDRVARVNEKVRRWRYGDRIPTPFMPGERALHRGPVVRDDTILFSTNEEADVVSIEASEFTRRLGRCDGVEPWIAAIPSWEVVLRRADETTETVHMVRDDRAFNATIARITDEAATCRDRWGDLHGLKSALAKLQSVYAMTVHTSQGSTFANAFVDVADIRRRVSSNLLEAQQLFYVAATRPSQALMLVNA